MATKKEKEELIQTLKFTPCDYRVEIGSYGGEIYLGTVDRKVYDFFKENKIDIEEYAGDWDDEKWEFVPEELRPFPPGAPYDCDNLAHEGGASFDSGNDIMVLDENGDEIWRCSLSVDTLEAEGVTVECFEEISLDDQPEGTVIFYGAQGEKGCLFGDDLHMTAPFDPKLLKITYSNIDGWEIVSGITYNGEELSNNGLDTTGKWGENKWIIVGDEEVYEGVYRDDADIDYDNESDDE